MFSPYKRSELTTDRGVEFQMANQIRFAKARDIADVFEALAVVAARNDLPFELADTISDEGLAAMRAELGRIVGFLESRPNEGSLVTFLKARLTERPHMGLPPLSAVAPLMVRTKKVNWKIHRFKNGPMKGKKEYWTAKWEGFDLRLNWLKERGKVAFVGFIDGVEVTRGALKSRVEAFVEAEAHTRLVARARKPS
jgi:hypothetical protein